MKLGDYTNLAEHYVHRPGYSLSVLKALFRYAGFNPPQTLVADVGAGTGKLTENLVELGFGGFAVEPNDVMRSKGIEALSQLPFQWSKGRAEETGLPDASVDWVVMGSSFHWTQTHQSLREFSRILKPHGYFAALWNSRDLKSSPFHLELEHKIHALIPHLRRVSSGGQAYTEDLHLRLMEGGYFGDPIFVEAAHVVEMSSERYLGAWKSVNDIQVQAGEKVFQEVLALIADTVALHPKIVVPYKTRAWMVRKS